MIFTLSSYSNNLLVSALITVIICAVIGLIHGVIINYLNTSSVLITLVTSSIITGVNILVLNGETVPIQASKLPSSIILNLSILLIALLITILLLYITKLGTPALQREDKPNSFSYALGYIASSVFAGTAGIIYAIRLNCASPIAYRGHLEYIILYFVVILASKYCDKNILHQ